MSQKLFRENALNRLSTPEELDKMIQITNLRGWIALIGLSAIIVAAVIWGIFGSIPTIMRSSGLLVRQNGIEEVHSPEAGQIAEVLVRAGDTVKEGQPIARLKNAAGQLTDLPSAQPGMVLDVLVEKDMAVPAQTILARVENTSRPLQAMLFLPLSQGKSLKPGTKVQFSPSNVRAEEYGYLVGKVSYVSQFPVTAQSLLLQLKSQELAQALAAAGPVIRVDVELEKDANAPTGFKWTTQSGPRTALSSGTLGVANLILGEQRPISLILPVLKEEGN